MIMPHNEFPGKNLNAEDLESNPLLQFDIWLKEYLQLSDNENIAMTLSTINRADFPSSRIVYLRDWDLKGYVFFTNYHSNKGQEIKLNNKASLLFYWPEMDRQVRIWGIVEKVEAEISDAYFENRPKGSQAGAWVSEQSKEIKDRIGLEKKHKAFLDKAENKIIPRPEFWGGYRLRPIMFEFWQGRENRLHDRYLYKKSGENWEIKQLAP